VRRRDRPRENPAVVVDPGRFNAHLEDLLTAYRINKRRNLLTLNLIVARLKKEFDGIKAAQMNTKRINAFVEKRLKEGGANATINRVLPCKSGPLILPSDALQQGWPRFH